MEEIWKDILGYEGLYQASSHGRIKSKTRIFHSHGTGRYKRDEHIMNLSKHSKGYFCVTLTKGQNSKRFLVHRLIAYAFLPSVRNKNQVNHIDGNKTNNNVTNLEWCSSFENQRHRRDVLDLGFAPGKTVLQMDKNGCAIKCFKSMLQAEKETGIKHQNISSACRGKLRSSGGFKWLII